MSKTEICTAATGNGYRCKYTARYKGNNGEPVCAIHRSVYIRKYTMEKDYKQRADELMAFKSEINELGMRTGIPMRVASDWDRTVEVKFDALMNLLNDSTNKNPSETIPAGNAPTQISAKGV